MLLALAGCAGDSPSDIRFVVEWGCLANTIAGNAAVAATPAGPPGPTLPCPRGGPGMSTASFRAVDANGDGQVPLAELLARAEALLAGRETVAPRDVPWLTEGQVRRLDASRTGSVTRPRLRELIAADFTRADRDGSATLTPGRWPLGN